MSIAGSSSGEAWKTPPSSWTCKGSLQSVGGPRAGEMGGGSSGSPRCVRIFRIGPGSVMKATPHAGHSSRSAQSESVPGAGTQFQRWNCVWVGRRTHFYLKKCVSVTRLVKQARIESRHHGLYSPDKVLYPSMVGSLRRSNHDASVGGRWHLSLGFIGLAF
jgi:hypothetical protein